MTEELPVQHPHGKYRSRPPQKRPFDADTVDQMDSLLVWFNCYMPPCAKEVQFLQTTDTARRSTFPPAKR
jgi:hypothetical protein